MSFNSALILIFFSFLLLSLGFVVVINRQRRILTDEGKILTDKQEYYIIIKGSIQQENITFGNIYATNTGAPKYIKQILIDIKGEIDSNTVVVGNFNTPLTSMAISSRQKINNETSSLKWHIRPDEFNLRVFHPKATEYTFFSSAHGIYFKMGHTLGHKSQ